MSGGGGGIHRHRRLFQQNPQPADVVAVLVGQENAVDAFQINSEPFRPVGELLRAESGIDQQAHATDLDHRRVSRTTATQYRQTHPRDSRKPARHVPRANSNFLPRIAPPLP